MASKPGKTFCRRTESPWASNVRGNRAARAYCRDSDGHLIELARPGVWANYITEIHSRRLSSDLPESAILLELLGRRGQRGGPGRAGGAGSGPGGDASAGRRIRCAREGAIWLGVWGRGGRGGGRGRAGRAEKARPT